MEMMASENKFEFCQDCVDYLNSWKGKSEEQKAIEDAKDMLGTMTHMDFPKLVDLLSKR